MDVRGDLYRQRWIGWCLLALAFFLVSLHRTATAVLSEELMQSFKITGTSLGALHSSFFYLYALFQLPAGMVTDRYGVRTIAAGGTGLMSSGALVFGFSSSYLMAFTGRLLIGFGASVLFVNTLRFCANWFRTDEFGTMAGATFTIGVLGGLAATTPLAITISLLGWRTTMLGLGVFGLLVAVGVLLFSHDSPKDAGLKPIDDGPRNAEITAQDLNQYITTAAREVETWLIGMMLFFMTGISVTIFGLWGIPFLVHSYNLSVTVASMYLLVGKLGGLIGPTLFGWLSDRLGRRTELIVFSTGAVTVTWGIFALFGSISLLLVSAIFLFGRILRGGIPITFTVMKERHPSGASGTVIGLVNTMSWIGAAVFPVIMGAGLDAYWTGEMVNGTRVYTMFGYQVAFAIATIAGALSVLCAAALHLRIRREQCRETKSTDIAAN